MAYSVTLTASGGSGGYTFTTTGANNLSTFGLSLAGNGSGLISGTPTGNGTASFTAKVTDSLGNTATQLPKINVYGGLGLPYPDPSSLESTGFTNQTYSGFVNGVGGTGTYQWSVNGAVVTGAGVPLGNGSLTATVS